MKQQITSSAVSPNAEKKETNKRQTEHKHQSIDINSLLNLKSWKYMLKSYSELSIHLIVWARTPYISHVQTLHSRLRVQWGFSIFPWTKVFRMMKLFWYSDRQNTSLTSNLHCWKHLIIIIMLMRCLWSLRLCRIAERTHLQRKRGTNA